MYVCLEPDKLVYGALVIAETTLEFTKDLIFVKVEYESFINHSLDCLANATSQGYGSVAICIVVVLALFWERND